MDSLKVQMEVLTRNIAHNVSRIRDIGNKLKNKSLSEDARQLLIFEKVCLEKNVLLMKDICKKLSLE